jgi:ATP-binding cassette subfamily B protein
MNEPIEIKDAEGKVDQEVKGHLEFKDVGFHYPGSDEMVLKNISFEINPGENIAIVGRTGSGKSTLVQFILRLFDPTEGEILLDGKNLKKWSLSRIRDAIGFVPQETFLFSDTIGDNIAFGVEDASQGLIEAAAEKAQVKENILDFEKKFKTMLGERGITLSGGQKQRTAIARALIKDPKILIFDDSLSAVDTKTEDAILKHLRQELSGRTTIMISHRISTIKDADKIYYIEEGQIVETGTHEALLAKDGRYTAMYNKQILEQELAEI